MTRDIKQLDIAKRNLTASITTLHHLHILLTGVESLGAWVDKKDYSSIARQLPAILNVLQLFDAYKESDQIANLSGQLDKLKASLTIQLAKDLKNAFQVCAFQILLFIKAVFGADISLNSSRNSF